MSTNNAKNPEILDLLHRDHQEVQALFDQFQESRSAGESEEKAKSISQQIFDDLKLHPTLEEKIVYPALKQQDDRVFYEAGEEHHVADLLIQELQQMPVSAPEYAAKMTVMQENVQHHIREEESEIFELIGQLPQDTLAGMAREWKQQKEQAMQGSTAA
jgi:hemerythrin-like domain-containing protein